MFLRVENLDPNEVTWPYVTFAFRIVMSYKYQYNYYYASSLLVLFFANPLANLLMLGKIVVITCVGTTETYVQTTLLYLYEKIVKVRDALYLD